MTMREICPHLRSAEGVNIWYAVEHPVETHVELGIALDRVFELDDGGVRERAGFLLEVLQHFLDPLVEVFQVRDPVTDSHQDGLVEGRGIEFCIAKGYGFVWRCRHVERSTRRAKGYAIRSVRQIISERPSVHTFRVRMLQMWVHRECCDAGYDLKLRQVGRSGDLYTNETDGS